MVKNVIKKTTGDTASSHIRRFVIQLAKNGLAAGETVSQVSDRLGFEYPPALQPDIQEAGGRYAVGVLSGTARLAQSERKVLSGIRFYCIHLFHHRSNESVTLTSSSPNVVFKSACEALSIFPNRVKFHELVS